MPGTIAGAVLLAALAVLSSGRAVAGPPAGAGSAMKLDKVEDGLRQYRMEKDASKRFEHLDRLAQTHDPRVGLVLGDLLRSSEREDRLDAAILLWRHFNRVGYQGPSDILLMEVKDWWKDNGPDLRRRAARLPR
jgi:hypothetical protein